MKLRWPGTRDLGSNEWSFHVGYNLYPAQKMIAKILKLRAIFEDARIILLWMVSIHVFIK